eukprot:1154012-Pelagomonas_calceolata.AAC.5
MNAAVCGAAWKMLACRDVQPNPHDVNLFLVGLDEWKFQTARLNAVLFNALYSSRTAFQAALTQSLSILQTLPCALYLLLTCPSLFAHSFPGRVEHTAVCGGHATLHLGVYRGICSMTSGSMLGCTGECLCFAGRDHLCVMFGCSV